MGGACSHGHLPPCQLEEADEEFAAELREQLRAQSERHSGHLAEVLQQQAGQLAATWSSKLEQQLTQQHSHHQLEMAAALARLQGIESMLNTVAAAGGAEGADPPFASHYLALHFSPSPSPS